MLQETGSQHCLAGMFGQFVALQLQPENEGHALFDCIGYFKTSISLSVCQWCQWALSGFSIFYIVAEFVKKKKHILRSLNTSYHNINFISNWLLDTVAVWMKCILYMWRVLNSDFSPHTNCHKRCNFPQSNRANLYQIRPWPQPSTSNPIHYSPPILPTNAVPELLTASLNKLTQDAWLELGTLTLLICFSWYSVLRIDHINRTHFTSLTNTTYELLAGITFIFTTTWFSALCRLYSSHHMFNIMLIFHLSHLAKFFSACSCGKILLCLVFTSQQFCVC
jgi:hypothetical protein